MSQNIFETHKYSLGIKLNDAEVFVVIGALQLYRDKLNDEQYKLEVAKILKRFYELENRYKKR